MNPLRREKVRMSRHLTQDAFVQSTMNVFASPAVEPDIIRQIGRSHHWIARPVLPVTRAANVREMDGPPGGSLCVMLATAQSKDVFRHVGDALVPSDHHGKGRHDPVSQ